ncbi:MAG TPA: DMT family transporter, partial [Solirubrobacteraceae bacterium]
AGGTGVAFLWYYLLLAELGPGRASVIAYVAPAFSVVYGALLLDEAVTAGTIEFLVDKEEPADSKTAATAHEAYGVLVEQATDRTVEPDELAAMSAYQMAATVDFGLDAKQGLLDLRSENARLRLVARLFRAAAKRLDFMERAQERARSNGKVRFG